MSDTFVTLLTKWVQGSTSYCLLILERSPKSLRKMYLSLYILAPISVILVFWPENIAAQSITFGGPSSGNGGGGSPVTTRKPSIFRPITAKGPVPPTPPPAGPIPSPRSIRTKRTNETHEDLLSIILQKIQEISRKQDHYQSILLNAIKENGTQETLEYLNSESQSLMEQVNITTTMAKEIAQAIVKTTTNSPSTNAILNENSTETNVDKRIGFSVRKAAGTNPSTFHLQASNIPISFQEVLSNVGNGWTGLNFKAPVAGHYFFTFHAQSSETGDFTMALRKNGQYQVTAYGGKSGYQWGSNSALLNLSAGDTVYLTLDDGEIYEHPNDEAYTTLTGFLVFQ